VRLAMKAAPNLIMDVQPQLFELFNLSGICPNLYRQRRTMPKFTKHCALPSLPSTLCLYNESYLRSAPYLVADPAMVEVWGRKLHGTSKIGICWKGSPNSERPYSRDVPQELFSSIMHDYSPVLSLVQEGQFESFADTAAAISALDLVITVDTSIAHLAGALGKTCWLLLSVDPDWRWGLSGERTIWYDSIRIFRQQKLLDWKPVIDAVEHELKHLPIRRVA